MKAGKEEIVGLLRALELYLDRDHDADRARWEGVVERWVADLDGVEGLQARRCFPNEAGQPVPRVRVEVDPSRLHATATDLADQLWDGPPRVMVLRDGIDAFYLTPDTLTEEQEHIVPQRIVATAREMAARTGQTVDT
jgi:L-seryl-tRNA(Ser) seleniumtransferase